jgi:hypothetical protein
MQYSRMEIQRLMNKGSKNMTIEDEIHINLLNYIDCIHLNKQKFNYESFDSKYFGDLEMTFKKDPSCLIGHCRTIDKKMNIVYDYLFTENGFEKLYMVI